MAISLSILCNSLIKITKSLKKKKIERFTLDTLSNELKLTKSTANFLFNEGVGCGLFVLDGNEYILSNAEPTIVYVKQLLAKKVIKSKSIRQDDDEVYLKAAELAAIYDDILFTYSNGKHNRYLNNGKLNKDIPTYSNFVKAALQADSLGVSYEKYVKAQFYFYDKWFGKAPKPHEMTTLKAKDRVGAYEKAIYTKKTNENKKILGKVRSQPIVSTRTKYEYSEAALRRLMKNYNATEEEILKVFAKGSQATLYFDKNWLESNATYNKLKSLGEV